MMVHAHWWVRRERHQNDASRIELRPLGHWTVSGAVAPVGMSGRQFALEFGAHLFVELSALRLKRLMRAHNALPLVGKEGPIDALCRTLEVRIWVDGKLADKRSHLSSVNGCEGRQNLGAHLLMECLFLRTKAFEGGTHCLLLLVGRRRCIRVLRECRRG